jgi:hypothetical protein
MKNDPTMQQITVDGYTFWTNSGFKPEELEVELINGAPTLKLKKTSVWSSTSKPAVKAKKGAFRFRGSMMSKVLKADVAHRPKSSQGSEGINWRKVEKEETAYLRSARGLSASPRILRGGKCSPR